MPNLTIFAGINGAGKTTLYNKFISDGLELENYICLDNFISNFRAENLYSPLLASRKTIDSINFCLDNKQSFCWETSVFGSFALDLVKKAKEKGYTTNIHFIYVDNANQSIERIANRVKLGGHNVSSQIVKSRFKFQTRNLEEILHYTDVSYFYENKEHFALQGMYFNKSFTFFNEEFGKKLLKKSDDEVILE